MRRVTSKVDSFSKQGSYFKITPQKNEIFEILRKLENFELNVMDVAQNIRD